jgi:hypothetical protein
MSHPHPLQGGRPSVAAFQELAVREAPVAVDDGRAIGIEPPRTAGELERSEGEFHGAQKMSPGRRKVRGARPPADLTHVYESIILMG